jgi:4-hydroxy-tetrahydrodipicolinate synthase
MREDNMLTGSLVAIVSPMHEDGTLDLDAFRRLLDWHIAEGTAGIVVVGTTGESPTVDFEEHEKLVAFAVKTVAGRAKVIAGTGGNSTAEALELTRSALAAGADATLQVTPYYNKPNHLGLVRHFSAVADLGLPVVLYNVPGRTAREIPVEVVTELSHHPKVVALKEAGGSVDRVSQVLQQCNLEVLSGDDSLILPMMAVGAVGVISVASNVAPKAVADLVHHALAGRWTEAQAIHRKFYPLFTGLFIDTNPIPVKAALALMGRIEEVYRLPLCETTPANRERLRGILGKLGLV